MPEMMATHTIKVMRAGKGFFVGHGQIFDFTDDEITEINGHNPESLRKPRGEGERVRAPHVNEVRDAAVLNKLSNEAGQRMQGGSTEGGRRKAGMKADPAASKANPVEDDEGAPPDDEL